MRDLSPPKYGSKSVDNALRLIHFLRDEGVTTVREASLLLEVAPSTAHRLLSSLVHRGFATHLPGGEYRPGPALSAMPLRVPERVRMLRHQTQAALEELAHDLNVTSHLVVRTGLSVRIVATADVPGGVGDRAGTVLPAHLASGGKVLLAQYSDQVVLSFYREAQNSPFRENLELPDAHILVRELRKVRRDGFGMNKGGTEPKVSSISVPIFERNGTTVASIGVSIETVKFNGEFTTTAAEHLLRLTSNVIL